MSCSPGQILRWAPIKALIDKVDAAAVTLETPGYSTLVSDTSRPFRLSDKVPISFWQVFTVSGGIITNRYMSLSPFGGPMTLPEAPNTSNMAGEDLLYFISDETVCMCKTLFKVKPSAGGHSLSSAQPTGCCPDWPVPSVGDALPDPEKFIPGIVGDWVTRGNPTNTTDRYTVPPCRNAAAGLGGQFASSEQGSALIKVSRAFTGSLTWPASSAKFFQEIWDKILFIADCSRHYGAKEGAWTIAPGDVIPEHCTPTIKEALDALKLDRTIRTNPGCIHEISSGTYPWTAGTCGGTDCDGHPLLYCETVNEMESFAQAIQNRMHPFTADESGCECCEILVETVLVCASCGGSCYVCNENEYDCGGTEGTFTMRCYLPPRLELVEDPPDSGIFVEIWVYDDDDYCEYDYSSSAGSPYWSETVSCDISESDFGGCPPHYNSCFTYETTSCTGAPLSPGHSSVYEILTDCPSLGEFSTSNTAYVVFSNTFYGRDSCFPNQACAGWGKFRLTAPGRCTDAGTIPDVGYTIKFFIDGNQYVGVAETAGTTTLTYNSEIDKFVSPWLDYPDWPNVMNGEDVQGVWIIEVDDE